MFTTMTQAEVAPTVTVENYARAETDYQLLTYLKEMDNFGKFVHSREPYDVYNQVTIRPNRDTLYSFGIFDITSPLTITLPEPGDRYQSLMIINQDHSISAEYGPQDVVLNMDTAGTRYVFLAIRTFMDPSDENDVSSAHALQDQVIASQADMGVLELPNWNKEEVESMRNAINVVASSSLADSSKFWGNKAEMDPVNHLFGAAFGWGGLPPSAAIYSNFVPEKNDGNTAYVLTAKDVPVSGFWSVTLYDAEGWIPLNDYDAYSFNNVTADKEEDGSIVIHFGGDPESSNYLPIVDGWNYIVRQYQPSEELIDGSWKFPASEQAN